MSVSAEAVTRSQAESKPRLVVMAIGVHPEVRAEKQSRSNVEQAAGQSRGDVQRTRLGQSQAILHAAQAARVVSVWVQMEFCWMSVLGSSWLLVPFASQALILRTGF